MATIFPFDPADPDNCIIRVPTIRAEDFDQRLADAVGPLSGDECDLVDRLAGRAWTLAAIVSEIKRRRKLQS